MVIDQTAKTAQIYVDGVAQPLSKTFCGTVVSGTTVNFSTCSFANTYSTTEPFTVGAYKGTGGTFLDFAGTLDEVRVYGSALTSQVILSQYNSASSSLFLTPLTSPSFSYTLTGTTGTITSAHTFKVFSAAGSAVGWHVTITSTLFTLGGNTLPSTSMTITAVSAACTAGQTCVVPTNGVSGYPLTVPAAATAPTAIYFFSANGGTGTGDVTVTATFSLAIPPGTAAGTYTSTVTETLIKGQ